MGHGIAGESLQTCAIGTEAELSIAQGQAPGSLIPGDVMPRHQRVTINGGLACRRRRISRSKRGERSQQQGGDTNDDSLHEWAQFSDSAARSFNAAIAPAFYDSGRSKASGAAKENSTNHDCAL
jgi:hypothetical protein